jgi:transposase-like protein
MRLRGDVDEELFGSSERRRLMESHERLSKEERQKIIQEVTTLAAEKDISLTAAAQQYGINPSKFYYLKKIDARTTAKRNTATKKIIPSAPIASDGESESDTEEPIE